MAVNLDELVAKVHTLPLDLEEQHMIDQAIRFIRYMADFKHSTGPFICGTGGKVDSGGLHERYAICAAYGSDYVAYYTRVKNENREPKPPAISHHIDARD